MPYALIVALILAGSSLATPAAAQNLLQEGKGLLGGGASGSSGGFSTESIVKMLEEQGYSKISNIVPAGGDTLKASAVNSSGSPVDLVLSKLGKIVSVTPK